jgi:hypothetical protein
MPARLTSVEQLMPFPTAAELIAAKPIKGVVSVAPDTSVLAAPICALLAVLATSPSLVLPIFSGAFTFTMDDVRLLHRRRQRRQCPARGAAPGRVDGERRHGAVITLLAVTGLTHKTSYMDIFAITLIKTAAVVVAIVMYSVTGIY